MTVRLNHTILPAHDKEASAKFLSAILGLSAPVVMGPFAVVRVGEVSLDYMDVKEFTGGVEIASQHFAFLVSEREFDEIFARIRERRMPYWSDPSRGQRDQINTWDDGRGVYFDDPNGHLLEVITRPYGSGGTTVSQPHPVVARTLEPEDPQDHASKPAA